MTAPAGFHVDSGWAQAIVGGIAIVFSTAVAIWVPYRQRLAQERRENRKRLDVTTTRFEPAGLQLNIRYVPEFTHVGLKCRVDLHGPVGATLKMLEAVTNPAVTSSGGYFTWKMGGHFIGGSGVVRLVRQSDGMFVGSMLVLPSAADLKAILRDATITVSVLTDAGDLLLRTKLLASPVDEVRSFWQAPAASV